EHEVEAGPIKLDVLQERRQLHEANAGDVQHTRDTAGALDHVVGEEAEDQRERNTLGVGERAGVDDWVFRRTDIVLRIRDAELLPQEELPVVAIHTAEPETRWRNVDRLALIVLPRSVVRRVLDDDFEGYTFARRNGQAGALEAIDRDSRLLLVNVLVRRRAGELEDGAGRIVAEIAAVRCPSRRPTMRACGSTAE